MMNELAPTHNNNETIKYMPQGRVNGHYVNMRARYIDQLEELRFRNTIRTAVLVGGAVALTVFTLLITLYFA